jgi:hypothetical protein
VYDDRTTTYVPILVAGGGGGAAQGHDIGSGNWPGIHGGDAGESGKFTSNVENPNVMIKNTSYYKPGGDDGYGVQGISTRGNWEGRGGGGGGYKGGGAADPASDEVMSGGGGSNYIIQTINDKTVEGYDKIIEVSTSTENGETITSTSYGKGVNEKWYGTSNTGNGMATIKWIPPEETTPPSSEPSSM